MLLLIIGGALIQDLVLVLGAAGGALLCRGIAANSGLPKMPVTMRAGGIALAVFLVL
jgi:hypothetical protein